MASSNLLTSSPPRQFIKESVAATLREKIVNGVIEPGKVIVEGKWAAHLGVAQGSIREALNILISEGFVQKVPGRRARVTKLAREDVKQIYQIRSSLEGLAARLVVEKQVDLSGIEKAWVEIKRASEAGDTEQLVNAHLRFHLLIYELSGNRFLLEHARRLLVPLFAFMLMRIKTNQAPPGMWVDTMKHHESILSVLRLGDPLVAEQFVMGVTDRFGARAYDDWEATPSTPLWSPQPGQ